MWLLRRRHFSMSLLAKHALSSGARLCQARRNALFAVYQAEVEHVSRRVLGIFFKRLHIYSQTKAACHRHLPNIQNSSSIGKRIPLRIVPNDTVVSAVINVYFSYSRLPRFQLPYSETRGYCAPSIASVRLILQGEGEKSRHCRLLTSTRCLQLRPDAMI